MRLRTHCILIIVICLAATLSTSCWKDRTLKDKTMSGQVAVQADITPSYGLPLLHYSMDSRQLMTWLNESCFASNFSVYFDSTDHNLGYFAYDKTVVPITAQIVENQFDTSGMFPMLEVNYPQGIKIHRAYIKTYVNNYYNADFSFYNANIYYADFYGRITQVQVDMPHSVHVPAATTAGNPAKQHLFNAIITSPMTLMGYGTTVFYTFRSKVLNTQYPIGHIEIIPEIHVPAWISLTQMEYKDTIAIENDNLNRLFNPHDSTGTLHIQGLSMQAKITNRFPIALTCQCVLLDENKEVLGDMFNTPIHVDAAPIDGQYMISQNTYKEFSWEVPQGSSLHKQLCKAKYILINGVFDTYKNSDVKLYQSNYLDIKINTKLNTCIKGDINNLISASPKTKSPQLSTR